MRSPLGAPLLALLLLLGGCECGGPRTLTRFGSLAVLEPAAGEGPQGASRESTVSLGFVPAEAHGDVTVELINLGQASLTLAGVERVDGDGFVAQSLPTSEAPFALTWREGLTLRSGESTSLTARFLAPAGTEQTAWRVVLRFSAHGAASDRDSVLLTLTATSAQQGCEVPSPLRAGAVKLGKRRRMALSLTNAFPTRQRLFVGVPVGQGTDALAFTAVEGKASTEVWMEPGETQELAWDFQPLEARRYAASVDVQRADGCPRRRLTLEGEGVEQHLTWTPLPLDFGPAWPGDLLERDVTFRNAGTDPVRVEALRIQPGNAAFALASTAPGVLEIPAEGEAILSLTFAPGRLGAELGTLRFETSLPEQPEGALPLRGFGGGPTALVSPNPLPFGSSAWFPGSPEANVHRRRLILSNLGTTVEPEDPRNRLHLGTRDASGAFAAPFFLFTSLDGLTTSGEFTLELGADFDPAIGLPATPGQNRRALEVVFTPTGTGPRSALLSLFTNDPQQPVLDVEVQANVVELPPCRHALRPARLDFGTVRPGDTRTLELELVNLGTGPGERCLVSDVRLEEGSDPAFTLDELPPDARELAPGDSLKLAVHFSAGLEEPPMGRSGALTLRVSNPMEPHVRVPLSGMEGRSCLLLAPDLLDFGTRAIGCKSATRTSTLYNVCPSDVSIQSIELTHGAGPVAGSPACPSPEGCPEFSLTGVPAIPAGGLRLASGQSLGGLTWHYQPSDFGPDHGTAAVTFTREEGSAPELAVVVLTGSGDTRGANVDVFREGGQPKADILLSIDDSGSMSDQQNRLSENLDSFFGALVAADVDFHIAVVRGHGAEPGYENGLFLTGPLHPDKILTPRTENVLAQFKEKVLVGVSGLGTERCLDPVYTSLTASRLANRNRGFLREGVPLSIVCITDEPDQDPIELPQYLAGFNALKRDENLFSISAIAVFNDDSCGLADDGRLRAAASRTDGVLAEVCSGSWDVKLERMGRRAAGTRRRFVLTSAADTQHPIEVVVEGVSVPRLEPSGIENWSYDPLMRAVTFAPFALPELQLRLEVHYTALCE